ncbi:MAG TPA: amidohydrolase family protein [candidate division Zixibacteria bacterium]|nr:amidohydrolase family protein [candidate division Zixibacteria bacterium]
MSLRIDGGVVVAWSGAGHELIPNGSVYIDGDRIASVGIDRSRPADRVIDAAGKLICPGFVNLHVHSQLNVGDYLLPDVTRKDYLCANYFVFGAPVKEKAAPPPPAAVAIGRKYALYTALRNGATTVLDPGGGPGDFEGYASIVGRLGGRVFFSPPYRSSDIFTDAEGRHYYEERADRGRPGLERAVEFIQKYRGAHNGRLQGILNPAQAETCEPSLLRETVAAARQLNVPIHLHAGGNLREFLQILQRYRKPVIEYLSETGILGPRTILGHMVFMGGHSRVDYPASELELLAASGATVGHCPHKCAKMGFAMESFARYLRAGVKLGLGTDTYPLDIIAEMRYASLFSRLVDRDAAAARPAEVFNAATVGGADALGREDLGRLAPGAKADLVIVDLRSARYGPVRDPINALVEYGSGADVETVVVDGEVVVEGGRSTRIDDDELFAEAQAAATRAWDNWPARDWAGRRVEQIVPPAFPTRAA